MMPAEELAVVGSIKDTPVIWGRKFAMHTLDSDAETMAESATSMFQGDAKERVLKVEKLARAITTIDGVPFSVTEDEKSKGMTELQKARQLVYKWQPTIVSRVYDELLKLEKKRDDAIAELEKNAQTPTTPSGAGR